MKVKTFSVPTSTYPQSEGTKMIDKSILNRLELDMDQEFYIH